MQIGEHFIRLAMELDEVGLFWNPTIGDEVSLRDEPFHVSVLVETDGMTPNELRSAFFWLPTVEQLVEQIEARQGILFHMGMDLKESFIGYKTVVQHRDKIIQAISEDMRSSVATALRDLLVTLHRNQVN